jgi:bifunctional non-homologous end joining protein LigD
VLGVEGREVRITHPDKMVFPTLGLTKRDLVGYYLAVADGALAGVRGRPMILKRFVKGIDAEAFFQKRAPDSRPEWIETATLTYRSGTSAAEVVVNDAAALAWVVNLGCVDLNPHPVRAADLDHPDELRIDLDPVPGVAWAEIVDVAFVVREVLAEHGLIGWPKTSGSRGFHVYARINPVHGYPQVRSAAQTVAREVERRVPDLATAQWWKEERDGVFVDFNQNAKDRTMASAWSVRPTPDARVSMPLTWDEVPGATPAAFTLRTALHRWAERGDPWRGMDLTGNPGDPAGGSLDSLLALADELGPPPRPPRGEPDGSGRRPSRKPLVEVARTATEDEARAAFETWAASHPAAAGALAERDVLVDRMRGRSSLWYRVRVNLENVPADDRPEQEALVAEYDPWGGRRG